MDTRRTFARRQGLARRSFAATGRRRFHDRPCYAPRTIALGVHIHRRLRGVSFRKARLPALLLRAHAYADGLPTTKPHDARRHVHAFRTQVWLQIPRECRKRRSAARRQSRLWLCYLRSGSSDCRTAPSAVSASTNRRSRHGQTCSRHRRARRWSPNTKQPDGRVILAKLTSPNPTTGQSATPRMDQDLRSDGEHDNVLAEKSA